MIHSQNGACETSWEMDRIERESVALAVKAGFWWTISGEDCDVEEEEDDDPRIVERLTTKVGRGSE